MSGLSRTRMLPNKFVRRWRHKARPEHHCRFCHYRSRCLALLSQSQPSLIRVPFWLPPIFCFCPYYAPIPSTTFMIARTSLISAADISPNCKRISDAFIFWICFARCIVEDSVVRQLHPRPAYISPGSAFRPPH